MDETNTLQNILNAGKTEFMEKGFKSASLRNIVRNAGVTTGAFYGYYASKEELFDALVGESADYFMKEYKKVQYDFKKLSPAEQEENMGKESGDWMLWITDYIYDHLDAFQLIISHSEGTKYEHFIHEMVEIEVEATHDFITVMRGSGKNLRHIDPQLEHILVSGMFTAFFEVVVHNMPKEQAKEYINELKEFQTAGWIKIMGL
ncbi:TetR/AcrR family transcriptional regulator [Kineothrix sedimenti]|uniref:TetR/AcrR family transcriptional regulator n=1 Tax=Kineothrix sedimenti TaxID=3123317 RepID=A0ABZ3F0M1_9FIRM